MVEINQFSSQPGFNQNRQNQTNQEFNQQNSFNQSQNQPLNNQLSPKGLFQIPDKFLQLIPLLPFALEMLTGQKIPATGVLADILSGVQSLQGSLSQVISNQNQI
jgi:hypothetical protein